MDFSRVKVAVKQIALVDSVELQVQLPEGSAGHAFRLEDDSIEWRFAESEAAAATGFPMEADDSLEVAGPVSVCSLWFYQASGGDTVLHWTYTYPVVK